MSRERIGTVFVKAGLISPNQLTLALGENKVHKPREKLGQTLVRLKLASDGEVARALSMQLGFPYIDLNAIIVDPYAVQKVPSEVAMKHRMLPIYIEKNNLVLAVEDPHDFDAVEAARFASGLNVVPHVAAFGDIVAGIKRYYAVDESASARAQEVSPDDDIQRLLQQVRPSEHQLEQLKQLSESPAVVKLVNTIIFQGIAVRASAIQFDPQEKELVVKNRVDGVLTQSMRVPKNMQAPLITRLKIMAGMDYTKRHIPQKGRTQYQMQQRAIEMEISCLPSMHGEALTIHILDTGESIPVINNLGFQSDNVMKIMKLLSVPQGLTLICGPPGSGKTATLYALAHELSRSQKKIITIEDSIEYQLKGAQQVQLNETAGLTFPQALQSVLRHNPNIIVLGELRDKETAEMAMQASSKGRLVLSLLRTPDILSTIDRLHELGVDRKLFASALSGIITQRLVRKICNRCREQYQPSVELKANIESHLGEKLTGVFSHGKGCQVCNFTGYQEKTSICHVVAMSPALQKLIIQGTTGSTIGRLETKVLLKNILAKVRQGMTTLEEMERVLLAPEKPDTVPLVKCPQCGQAIEPGQALCPACQQAQQAPPVPEVKQEKPPALEVKREAPPVPVEQPIPAKQPSPAPTEPPVQSASSGMSTQEETKTAYGFRGRKILLVDTDKKMLQELRVALRERDFGVLVATNGDDALKKIRQYHPDMMITEVMLPKLNGLGLVRKIRQNTATAQMPIIILSKRAETADRLKGFAIGTDDYVPKPFSTPELIFRINAILRRTYKS